MFQFEQPIWIIEGFKRTGEFGGYNRLRQLFYYIIIANDSAEWPMSAEISARGAQMIFETLHYNAIPVVAFYRRDGIKVMNHGVLAGISDEHGILIAPKSPEPLMDYLAVSLGIPKGLGCKFEYADEWSEPADKANIDERLGEAILLINFPDGGQLRLHIPSGVVSRPSS